jgi:non-specific serine/threonine protein kinase
MAIWSAEIKELEKLHESLKGQLPDLEKELEQLIRTEDANVIMLYSRRCIEVIITELCECELKRPRKTEPLKGIIDKLNKEEKVPSHIIISMDHVNSMSAYGTHPKEFDPQQVRPVLINLTTILNWYLNYHDIKSLRVPEQKEREITPQEKKHNLPISITSFIGREKEMKEVRDLFQKSRLVTLAGAGGCGKTRLAREIAQTLVEEYKDGVWFTDLSSVTDPGFVGKAIARALNIKEDPGKAIIDTLIENIKNKSLLLLLDNCEHLIEACAEAADKLLHSVKGLRILATSREALNIPGEVVWRIPSLSFPDTASTKDIDEVQHYDAIKLFADRAGSSKPGFAINIQNVSPVVGICQCVAGIPLAIELAATRIRHLDLETILKRLEDQFNILSTSSRTVPERQQTLRATIDWSYNLLSEQEQLLFNRLSVFAGDFSLEAIEEVCSDEKLENENIITLLSQLVDKSLVIAENQEDESVRYKYLGPLQQYSLQKLNETGKEEKLRELHLLYFLKLAELAYEEQSELQLKWLAKLEQEHDNMIAALNWSDNHSPEQFIRLSGALAWFWLLSSHIIMGKDYLEKALLKDIEKSEVRARALHGLGSILLYFEDTNRAISIMNESLAIWRQSKNIQEEAIVLREISLLYHSNRDHETGTKCSLQSLKIAREIGKQGLINHCLLYVCMSLIFSKKFDQAKPLVEELFVSSEKLNQPFGIMCGHHYGGDCALGIRNFKEAEKNYGLAVVSVLKYGNNFQVGVEMQGVAFSVSGQSRWAKAIRLDAAAHEIADKFGLKLDGMADFWDDWIKTYLGEARKEVGEELTRKYEEEGKNMGFEAAIKYALDFDKD